MLDVQPIRNICICLLAAASMLAGLNAQAGPGAETYNEFLEKEIIYPDEDWQEYVAEVGERILAVTPHAGKNYTFVVTDQSMVNAFATQLKQALSRCGMIMAMPLPLYNIPITHEIKSMTPQLAHY